MRQLTTQIVEADASAARAQSKLPYSELLKVYGGKGEVHYKKCSPEQVQFDPDQAGGHATRRGGRIRGSHQHLRCR